MDFGHKDFGNGLKLVSRDIKLVCLQILKDFGLDKKFWTLGTFWAFGLEDAQIKAEITFLDLRCACL